MSPHQHYATLLEYLTLAETRPGMYFGSNRVDDIRHHLDGWRSHRRIAEDGDNFADHFFNEFHRFVASVYNDDRSIGWNGLVRENSASDEEGFETFMALVRQFAAEFQNKTA